MTTQDQISLDSGSRGHVNLIYILYLVGLFAGLTALIGVVMAYAGKDRGEPWILSHYHNQINIFWKALFFAIVGFVLTFVLIGGLIILGAVIWYVVRTVRGMQALARHEAISNPGSWGL